MTIKLVALASSGSATVIIRPLSENSLIQCVQKDLKAWMTRRRLLQTGGTMATSTNVLYPDHLKMMIIRHLPLIQHGSMTLHYVFFMFIQNGKDPFQEDS